MPTLITLTATMGMCVWLHLLGTAVASHPIPGGPSHSLVYTEGADIMYIDKREYKISLYWHPFIIFVYTCFRVWPLLASVYPP